MRIPESVQSATALCLFVLLGALGTGMPSHSHADGERPLDRDSHGVTADHHSHGTQLVEQDERAPSGGPQLAVLPAVVEIVPPAVARTVQTPQADAPRPMERSPPPGAPRAPPFAA